ncbi:hypothetical protein PQX77_021578 [Marasmius sp. AFHP31]|nr:hypothetical protein PQX77_021578 [Marasmius sp. AFHP31]
MGNTILDRLPGGAPFASPSTSMSTSGSLGGTWSPGGSPSRRTTPTSSVYDSDSDSDSDSCSSVSDESTTSVEEDEFVPESRIYHLLVAINDHILFARKDVDIVVTHDDDWISLLDYELDGDDMPDDSTLISRLENKMAITVNELGHATVNENVRSGAGTELSLPSQYSKAASSPHHWSFHRDGQFQLPLEISCLRVPIKLDSGDMLLPSCSDHDEGRVHFQVVEEFVYLSTFDIFHHVNDPGRFKKLHDQDCNCLLDHGGCATCVDPNCLTSTRNRTLVDDRNASGHRADGTISALVSYFNHGVTNIEWREVCKETRLGDKRTYQTTIVRAPEAQMIRHIEHFEADVILIDHLKLNMRQYLPGQNFWKVTASQLYPVGLHGDSFRALSPDDAIRHQVGSRALIEASTARRNLRRAKQRPKYLCQSMGTTFQGCPEECDHMLMPPWYLTLSQVSDIDQILSSSERPCHYFCHGTHGDCQSNLHFGSITHNGAQEQSEGSIDDSTCPLLTVMAQQNPEAVPQDPGAFSEAIATSRSCRSRQSDELSEDHIFILPPEGLRWQSWRIAKLQSQPRQRCDSSATAEELDKLITSGTNSGRAQPVTHPRDTADKPSFY